MGKKIKYFNSKLGKSSNSGDNPFEPLRDADDFNKLVLDPGDEVRFHAGDTFEGLFNPTRSGEPNNKIKASTYLMGGERTIWANFKADSTATRPISWDVNASGWDLDHLQASDARYAGFVFREKQAHIRGTNLRMRRCGVGARLRGSYIVLDYADVQQPTMSRAEGKVTDEGGLAFSIETSNGYLNTDNVIRRPYVNGAIAAAPNGFDGGGGEIFGEIIRAIIEAGFFSYCDGGIEAGGPTPAKGSNWVATTRDVLIRDNFFINTNVLALFNDPAGTFPIRLINMAFIRNTVVDRIRNRSAVFLNGKWLSLDGALLFDRNVYSGHGSFIGAGAGTDLSPITRSNNIYHRVGGGGIGYALGPGDQSGDPLFADVDAWDFRLKRPMKSVAPGAAGYWMAYESALNLKWLTKESRTPFSASDIKGGHHTFASHRHMYELASELREAGMTASIPTFDHTFRLAPDKKTWLDTTEEVF